MIEKNLFLGQKNFLIEISDYSGPLQTSKIDAFELILAYFCHFEAVYSQGKSFWDVLDAFIL